MTSTHAISKIALTGGPCGGKTTLMKVLRTEDPLSSCWLMVPEVAPLLFQTGFNGREKSFQKAVVRMQIALEDAIAETAKPEQILLCHRGTLDPLAYWLRSGWAEEEFFTYIGEKKEDHFRRYRGVIHLQTVAIGAEHHYRRWPDAHRSETTDQAAEIDRLCAKYRSTEIRFGIHAALSISGSHLARIFSKDLAVHLNA